MINSSIHPILYSMRDLTFEKERNNEKGALNSTVEPFNEE